MSKHSSNIDQTVDILFFEETEHLGMGIFVRLYEHTIFGTQRLIQRQRVAQRRHYINDDMQKDFARADYGEGGGPIAMPTVRRLRLHADRILMKTRMKGVGESYDPLADCPKWCWQRGGHSRTREGWQTRWNRYWSTHLTSADKGKAYHASLQGIEQDEFQIP